MARQEKIVLWIDRRWKDAIEKHLKDETLQEHLEDVLDELYEIANRDSDSIKEVVRMMVPTYVKPENVNS